MEVAPGRIPVQGAAIDIRRSAATGIHLTLRPNLDGRSEGGSFGSLVAHVPGKWDPFPRKGHAPTRESTAHSRDPCRPPANRRAAHLAQHAPVSADVGRYTRPAPMLACLRRNPSSFRERM